MKDEELLRDVKFANWNHFYNDLTKQISEIRESGHLVLFVPKEVNQYYSRITNLYSTIEFAITDKDIIHKLDKIEENIFSDRYIKDLKYGKVTKYQRTIISCLRKIFTQICNDLSESGLIPKVMTSKKDNRPGAAKMRS